MLMTTFIAIGVQNHIINPQLMYVSHFTTSSFCPVTITVPQTPLDLVTNPIEKNKILILKLLTTVLPS